MYEAAGEWPNSDENGVRVLSLRDTSGQSLIFPYDTLGGVSHFLVVIEEVHVVLSEIPGERDILFRALSDAANFWAGKTELPGQEKVTFQTVLPCPPEVQEEILHKIHAW
ncbi:hypothetical protein ACR6C2_40430 [Streptomyces sp. INA 01156]